MKSPEMFLEELAKLLDQYEATILRGAQNPYKIVISAADTNYFTDFEFDTDIDAAAIKNKNFGKIQLVPF